MHSARRIQNELSPSTGILRQQIGEQFPEGEGATIRITDPTDPSDIVCEGRAASIRQVASAVSAAASAFPGWAATPVADRARVFIAAKAALENQLPSLAELVVRENGKTRSEAMGDLRRGLDVLEYAAGAPSLMKGDAIASIAKAVDGFEYREPLGVVAGATPFNFPAMIPLWMFPVAIACGNTFVLKPSDRCPATATKIAEIVAAAGLPPGVLNVVQGGRSVVEALIDHPDVRAFSFVGSSPVAEAVWQRATAIGKRAQCLGGAKNFIVVLSDADPDSAIDAVVGSSFGCAGQRCMASSVLVTVGDADRLLPRIVDAASKLQLGSGLDPGVHLGPVVSSEHLDRVRGAIADAVAKGARVLLDGRNAQVEGYPDGHFVGPTVLDQIESGSPILDTEIFGPVLAVIRCAELDEAVELVNASRYGNGASLFTSSGAAARTFRTKVDVGMVGINAGVPAPMAFFSFGGRKKSFFGDLKAHGLDGVTFYTQKKSVIERWPAVGSVGDVWARK